MSNALEEFLANLPPGPVTDTSAVEGLLRDQWHNFTGSEEGGMQAYKLSGRCEELCWQPPFLTFSIERHGGTVNGSTRAEVQSWKVDVSAGTAAIISTRRRQLYKTAPRVKVNGFAEEIARAIINEQNSALLKRYPDGRVNVLIATIIPDDTYPQTVAGRRRRFRRALEDIDQWEKTGWPEEALRYMNAPSWSDMGYASRDDYIDDMFSTGMPNVSMPVPPVKKRKGSRRS